MGHDPMPKAGFVLNTSRRSLLGALAAAPIAALPAVALAGGDDAELIRLCNRILSNRAAQARLLARRHTIADEKRTEREMDALHAEWQQIINRIVGLEVRTQAGAIAMARAAMVNVERNYPRRGAPPSS